MAGCYYGRDRHTENASRPTGLQGTQYPPPHSSLPGVHTRALQASASSQPPPSAMPATAATVGLGPEQGVGGRSGVIRGRCTPSAGMASTAG